MLIRENKVYSQNGEDGIIASIFEAIGPTNRFFAEIGCENGDECNTRKLSEIDGWSGIRIDDRYSDPTRHIYQHTVSPENVTELLLKYGAPEVFDLFSVDVDFFDFHILQAVLTKYKPRVIVSEYNSSLGPQVDCVVPYIPGRSWDRTNFFGASYTAFDELGRFYGYKVVHCDVNGVNIFLVKNELLTKAEIGKPDSAFRPPGYNGGRGHPTDPKRRRYLKSDHYLLPGTSTTQTQFGVVSYFNNDVYIGRTFSEGRYWEIDTIMQIARMLDGAQGLVLDIGAHIGSHSLALASINPALKFVCFEPQRPVFLLLERNILENDLASRFELLNVAVTDSTGQIRLSRTVYVEETSKSRAISYGGTEATNLGGVQLGIDGQLCQSMCIDKRIWPRVIYVKVDAEGAEPLVVYGMQGLLKADLPYILFEERSDRRLDSATLDLLGTPAHVRNFSPTSYLESLGYKLQRYRHDVIGQPPQERWLKARHATADYLIPAKLFQTWKSKHDFPENYFIWSRTFSEHNPSFERILWDDDDNRRFIEETFPWFLETYRNYPLAIYRADAIRYFFLYAIGGIYADMDTECLRPLDALLDRGDILLGRMGSNPEHPHSIPNAIMASKPRQEFWLLVMWLLVDFAKRGGDPEYLTGPVLLKTAVDLYLARDPEWVKSAIHAIAELLPPELKPVTARSKVMLLSNREWFAVDWTDPLHQLLRREILIGNLLSDERKRELFPDSWMVTY